MHRFNLHACFINGFYRHVDGDRRVERCHPQRRAVELHRQTERALVVDGVRDGIERATEREDLRRGIAGVGRLEVQRGTVLEPGDVTARAAQPWLRTILAVGLRRARAECVGDRAILTATDLAAVHGAGRRRGAALIRRAVLADPLVEIADSIVFDVRAGDAAPRLRPLATGRVTGVRTDRVGAPGRVAFVSVSPCRVAHRIRRGVTPSGVVHVTACDQRERQQQGDYGRGSVAGLRASGVQGVVRRRHGDLQREQPVLQSNRSERGRPARHVDLSIEASEHLGVRASEHRGIRASIDTI